MVNIQRFVTVICSNYLLILVQLDDKLVLSLHCVHNQLINKSEVNQKGGFRQGRLRKILKGDFIFVFIFITRCPHCYNNQPCQFSTAFSLMKFCARPVLKYFHYRYFIYFLLFRLTEKQNESIILTFILIFKKMS